METIDKLFAGFAIAGGALFVIRLGLMLIGGDGDFDGDMDVDIDVDADFDVDGGDFDAAGDSDASFQLLSLQTVTAFIMMFGLGGLALRMEAQATVGWAILGASVVGFFAVFVIAKIMQWLRGLQSSGTLDMRNAVGEDGSVYLTIQAGDTGKVRVTVQERSMVVNAMARDGREIKTGERVRVVGLADQNTLVVDRLRTEGEEE